MLKWQRGALNVLVVLLLLVSSCPPVSALERFDIVTTRELQEMLEEREQGRNDFVLVNALDALIANHHTIPGSVNVPWAKAANAKELLGDDMDKLIITYCMGYR